MNEQAKRRPKVATLRKTSLACPSQWEEVLEDGRVVYARYRHGGLSVGFGDDIREAICNGKSDQALNAAYVGDGLVGSRTSRNSRSIWTDFWSSRRT